MNYSSTLLLTSIYFCSVLSAVAAWGRYPTYYAIGSVSSHRPLQSFTNNWGFSSVGVRVAAASAASSADAVAEQTDSEDEVDSED